MGRRMQLTRSILIVLLVAGFAYASSVAASVFTYADDDSVTHDGYLDFRPTSIVLTIRTDSLTVRDTISKQLTTNFESRGIEIHLSHELFPESQDWDEDHRWTVYDALSIEAELVVAINATGESPSSSGRRPRPSATALPAKGNAPSGGYGYGIGGLSAGTGTSSNGSAAITTTSYGIVLFDLAQNRAAWTATIFTHATGGIRNYKSRSKAAAKRIIRDLIRKNHIPKK